MVIELATVAVVEGQQQEFEQAFSIAQQYLTGATGYRSYRLLRCLEQPNRYVLQIEWDTLKSHTEDFRNSSAYQAFRQLVYSFYAGTPEVLHYEVLQLPSISSV
ncbi:MAG: antibiotic biosynthesis monooxygenase [Chroococcidiopsidaceae cyanobacterium CP_BM_ER_R8_30]|nr:antibiotic biosynthesis monooxygenase [Chroococcidiopsidaceae cyanobacterium CP_BM_ER_R8_30]